ncbi:carboxylesterase [Aureobasidium pullulans]|uniref:Carboxylic ester hydrolase n=1 Tax=Aureobasidium pullulans TaxID=5580 RepID=A0A4S8W214_AURPU|nr:carboxylesterase [Aureobasidium pullulans]
MAKFSKSSYTLDLGELGCIEGLSVTDRSSSNVLCHYFGGIPYAHPVERFRAPRHLPLSHRYGSKEQPAIYIGQAGVCPQPGFIGLPNPSIWDEDCLQLNIWIPSGDRPAGGWPVLFYIHGGWLQFGDPNLVPGALAELLSETAFKAIVVMPAYRLNAFGFLAGKELEDEARGNNEAYSNFGFWDQRTALEWTHDRITSFGGDKDNITVAGYSAGSYSTFQQLAYDVYLPERSAIIKRVAMLSNGPGIQPRSTDGHQKQFDELLRWLDIPLSLSPAEKLSRLRKVPTRQIISAQSSMKLHEFRPVTDGSFISKDIIQSINDGSFAKQLIARGIKIMNGEVQSEHYLYGAWRTPDWSYDAVYERLTADYPESKVKKLMELRVPGKKLPAFAEDWPDLFGRLYADIQVHDLERGFADRLSKGGFTIGKDLLRYRIDWRAKCADFIAPPDWKVTHSTDRAIWFWGCGLGQGLTVGEKKILEEINGVFARFVKGEDVQWSQQGPKMMYRLKSNGEMDMWEDDRWERGLEGWNVMNE